MDVDGQEIKLMLRAEEIVTKVDRGVEKASIVFDCMQNKATNKRKIERNIAWKSVV